MLLTFKFSPYCLILLSIYVNSIVIILTPNHEICIHKELSSSDTLKVSYIVSGENESSTTSKLHGPFLRNYYTHKNQNKGNYETEIENEGIYSLCFESSTGSEVSFEFFSHNEGGHIVNIAKEGVFSEMNKNITYISEQFEEIESNLKFYAERRQSHNKIITDLIDIIKHITIFKVSIIILVSLVQILMIKSFFGNKKVDFNLSNPFSDSKI